jgi:hypothetical protein
MSLTHALFFTAIAAFVLTIVISFWINKLGGFLSLLGYFLVFLALAVAVFLFICFAPDKLLTIAWCIGLGIVVLTLIIHLISQI